MSAKKQLSKEPPLSFEEAYQKLESIVATLDSSRGGLEESLANFEEGMKLLNYCREQLESASRRIELLKGANEQGRAVLEELNEDVLRSQEDISGRQSVAATDISSDLFQNHDQGNESFDS